MDVADLVPAGSVAMTRWLREPLLHFAVLAAALLAVERRLAPEARRIVVPAEVVRGLRQDHLRRTGMPPTPAEEAGLVERWVDDEVLVREALALGLDRGDVIVRRRLVQKMEILAEGPDAPAPSDAVLAEYLARHAERYATPARVSLTQVWAGPGVDAAAARALRARLAAGTDPAAVGAPFVAGRSFARRSEQELADVFGADFAAAAMGLPVGEWAGPVRSSYGFHLVLVRERQPGYPPVLDEVRAAVTRDWQEEERAARVRAARAALRARYAVAVEDDGESGQVAAR
ncbi:MAG TPA: peptidylprolyl isomerase [Candidatus Binatia bacterium]|nr:peptidylprolyl isomerase [Candidatus Binatia bacterium]